MHGISSCVSIVQDAKSQDHVVDTKWKEFLILCDTVALLEADILYWVSHFLVVPTYTPCRATSILFAAILATIKQTLGKANPLWPQKSLLQSLSSWTSLFLHGLFLVPHQYSSVHWRFFQSYKIISPFDSCSWPPSTSLLQLCTADDASMIPWWRVDREFI